MSKFSLWIFFPVFILIGLSSVTVNAQIKPKIITPGSMEVCTGESVILKLDRSYKRYLWSYLGSKDPIVEIKKDLPGDYYFWCNAYDERGNFFTSDTVKLTVFPRPEPSLIQYNTQTKLLSATQILGDLQWYFGEPDGNETLIEGANSSVFRPKKTGYYFAKTINERKCSANSNKVYVCFPSQIVVYGARTLCVGSSTVLDAGYGYPKYLWSNGEKNQAITFTGINPGNYSLYCTLETNDCILNTDTISIKVLPSPPIPTVKYDSVLNFLTLYSADNFEYQQITWYKGDGISPDTAMVYGNNIGYPPKEGGNYYAVVTNKEGCAVRTKIFRVKSLVSRTGLLDKDGIDIYPNPSDRFLHIRNFSSNHLLMVQVLDPLGRVVYKEIKPKFINSELIIDAENFIPGIYHVIMVDEKIRQHPINFNWIKH